MYKAFVRRSVRTSFRALSGGDYEQVLRQFHPQVVLSWLLGSSVQKTKVFEKI